MKYKTSKKAMKENYNKIIKIGYCEGQYLLQYENPIAYSTRAEGWACDFYDIDNVLISTGYAPIDNKNANTNYNTIREYDNQAREIVYSNDNWEDKKIKVRELLKDFISEV